MSSPSGYLCDMESTLIVCLKNRNCRQKSRPEKWSPAVVDEHYFRLHLDPAASDPSSRDSGPLVELDVSVPSGFGAFDGTNTDESFVTTLPGTATHHPALSAKTGIRVPAGAAAAQPRANAFSDSEWEAVREANSNLIEKLERIAVSASRSPDSYLDSVMDAVETFGEKVVQLMEKRRAKEKGKKEVDNVNYRRWERSSDDDEDEDGADSEVEEIKDPNDNTEVVSKLEALAREADSVCRTSVELYRGYAQTSQAALPPAGSLLRWCSVTHNRDHCAIIMSFDILALGAGNSDAMQSSGLMQPLLLVLLRFSRPDWESYTLFNDASSSYREEEAAKASTDCSSHTKDVTLPRPADVVAFQAKSMEDAQERVQRYFKTRIPETGVKNEVPLEWWSSQAKRDHTRSTNATQGPAKRRSLENGIPEEWPLSLESWVDVVVEGMNSIGNLATKSKKHADRILPSKKALAKALPKLHLVVQDHVKQQQRKALQSVIPGMVEGFIAQQTAAKGETEAKYSMGDADGLFSKLQANAVLTLLLHVAGEMQWQHVKCPSCGTLLPAATSRLRSCTNSLCLFNSEELGPNMGVLSELHSSVDAAELQLDLAWAAAGESARDVFEPFPSFLLRKDDPKRGRSGWFESPASASSNGSPRPAVAVGGNGLAGEGHQGGGVANKNLFLANKDLSLATTLIKSIPSLEALSEASTVESSLKLQLGAVWVRSQICAALPAAIPEKGVNGGGMAKGEEEYMRKPFLLYDFMRFILFTNRLTLFPLHESPLSLPLGDQCVYQFLVLRESPERQAHYEHRKAVCKNNAVFAFHGSDACNWFSILRNGLRSMSNTHYMSAGASYGAGIYMAKDARVSLGYARPRPGRREGKLSKGFTCLAICELLLDDISIANADGNCASGYYVVPQKEEANVFVRYLVIRNASAPSTTNWVISDGFKLCTNSGGDDVALRQAAVPTCSGETVDLREHSSDAVVAHLAQLEAEKQKIWRDREGAVRPKALDALCGTDGNLTADASMGMWKDSSEAEDDGLMYSDEEDDYSYDDIDSLVHDTGPLGKRSKSKDGDIMDWEPCGTSVADRCTDPGVATPPAPVPSAKGAQGPCSTSGPCKSTTKKPAKGDMRSPAAIQAVQREYRKLSAVQNKGNDTLPKGEFELTLPDESDFFSWRILLRPKIFKGSSLEPDLADSARSQSKEEVPVVLDVLFPDDFPFAPPFLRVVSPRFAFHTGHITVGGSICMELLTASGWSPAYTMEAVIVQVISEMVAGGARLDPSFMGQHAEYSMAEAKQAFTRVAAQHGWKT